MRLSTRPAPGTTQSCAILVLSALLVGLGWCAPPAVGAQGLALDKATEKEVDDLDRPNPHAELSCTECHQGTPSANDTWATVKFVNGEEGNVKLCLTCHDIADRDPHPVNLDPATAKPVVTVAPYFPLERVGENKGRVVCSTCHFVHSKTAGLKLLRGFPESSAPEDVAKGRFRDRRQLCQGCHGEDLKNKSPHRGGKDAQYGRTCQFCHPTEPKAGEPVKFTRGLIQSCDFCHAATKGGHFLLVNPFADPNLKEEVAKSNLPMIGGGYNCVSCHNPHGGTGYERFLRQEFVTLALKSARVRPHFMKAFCEACHTVRPKVPKGAPGSQPLAEIPLRESDANALCNRCHESGLSKANAHPLVKVAEKYLERIPKSWPLGANGELTCLTCHTGGDSPVLDPDNPNFLRGAPYESRNGMCWVCHKQEEFRTLNPHEKINDLEGCEFCHSVKPDIAKLKAGVTQDVKFKGDIIVLCIRCHDTNPHPGGQDHTGPPDKALMQEKNIILPKLFPLDRLGRVTCATCHNPHAEGGLRGDFVGMMVCVQCHKSK